MRRSPHLVLAGFGHAHAFVLESLARGRLAPARVTLVSPDREYFYSGMVSGVIAGRYRGEEACLSPPRLARGAGATWLQGAVARVDAVGRSIELEDGREIGYDLLSLNVGSRLVTDGIPGGESGVPIRPFSTSIDLYDRAAAMVRQTLPGRVIRIVVVGGGAAGWEVAMSLDAALARAFDHGQYGITIVDAAETVLTEHPESVRRRGMELLARRGIEFLAGARVREADPETVRTDEGRVVGHELLIWATGPRAPAVFRSSGLPTNEQGYLLVHGTLQSEGDGSVFGAGDCVGIIGRPWVPKAGVYAVREGPVLARNLVRRLRGERLETYEPQRRWLSLMNSGDGRALASYGGLTAHGRALWWLKDRIDRRFIERFQRLQV